MPIIKVENLTKVFGEHPRQALDLVRQKKTRKEIVETTGQTVGVAEASFEVREGEILVIMGLSGSGKSTLVRLVNRLIEPTAGKVWIEGEEVTGMTTDELLKLRRHKIGMVFQRFALYPHRTVAENAEYGLEIQGVAPAKRRERAMEILEMVGLKGWEHQLPAQLSGGMQQRVGLARAITTDPDIILMDEALSALDPLIRKDMQNEIIDLQRKLNKTVLFITHDLDEAINMGDRIILMKDGWIVQEGTAEEILTNPANRYVERFVEDVDMAKVVTAGGIMKKIHTVVHPADGPHVILRKLGDAGTSTLFAVDSHGKLTGFVRANKVREAVEAGTKENKGLIEPVQKVVSTETALTEIVPMMAENFDPVAVVDDENVLKGVIVMGTLMSGLAEGSETNHA